MTSDRQNSQFPDAESAFADIDQPIASEPFCLPTLDADGALSISSDQESHDGEARPPWVDRSVTESVLVYLETEGERWAAEHD